MSKYPNNKDLYIHLKRRILTRENLLGYEKLSKNLVLHQRRKHIELCMHFIRNIVHDRVIEVLYCPTDDQVVDIFTKSLTEAEFSKLRSMLGVHKCVLKGGIGSNASFLLLILSLL